MLDFTLENNGGGGAGLPDQTGHSGEFLTTNGTSTSWGTVDTLPSQTGNANKVLTTNGTTASWTEQYSREIGEIVQSTIPLTDAGLHLLDGSVISGSGSYSAFVDYIADLYTETYTETETAWVQPILTSNGTLGGSRFAVSSSSNWSNDYLPYKAMDGTTSTWWASDSSSSSDFIFYNPLPLKVTQLSWSSYENEYSKQGTIYGSNDGSNWTSLATYTSSSATVSVSLSSNTSFYKYYKINSTAYQSSDFSITELNITATYIKTTSCFTSEENWQQSVTNYGVCGKFVYDSVNNTVRLPKITGFIEGGTTANIGDLTEAGLPNITGDLSTRSNTSNTGAFSTKTLSTSIDGANTTAGTTFDASQSNAIYGNSNTVQPQSVKILYYIVVATTTKTDIQVDIDNVVADLNDLSSEINTKQDLLVSGTNIKTINGEDLLGEGNLEVGSGISATGGLGYDDKVLPRLSANGTMGGDTNACQASSEWSSNYAWKAYDDNASTAWISGLPPTVSNPINNIYYSAEPIQISKVEYKFNADDRFGSGVLYGSTDGTIWDELGSFTNTSSTTAQILVSSENKYNYIKTAFTSRLDGGYGSANTIDIYEKGNDLVVKVDNNTIKINANGELYVDISAIQAALS